MLNGWVIADIGRGLDGRAQAVEWFCRGFLLRLSAAIPPRRTQF
jgi:hypothetical protein